MEQETKSQSGFDDACSSPLFVFIHGKSKKKSQTFYSLSKKRLYVRSIHELRNVYNCWSIPQGGLILSDHDSNKFILFNHATMAKVELPQMQLKLWSYGDFLLSSPPTDQQCVVMCRNFRQNQLLFCQLGRDKWVKYHYDPGDDNIISSVVACKGKFYGFTCSNKFLSIEYNPQPSLNMLVEEHKTELAAGLNMHRRFLLESCEEIFFVQAYIIPPTLTKIVHVSVGKFNFTKKEWESVGSIGGDRIFFLRVGFTASWSASELGVKGDCIYFVQEEDKCLYTFDLEEGTISTHLPCPKVPSPWSTPFWIMPAF